MDVNGVTSARYTYDPYGKSQKTEGALEASFRFTGHFYHQGSGLHLAPFRAYDATLGIWISRDPTGEKGGMNLYAYVRGNPIGFVDPLGWSGEPTSITHYENGPFRIDSEVPVKGQQQGGIHIQDKRYPKNKWAFDTQTGSFKCVNTGKGIPKELQKEMQKNRNILRKLQTAINRVNENGGFAAKYGGGRGRLTALAFVGLVASAAQANAYMDACERESMGDMSEAALDIAENLPAGEANIYMFLMQPLGVFE
jgi:RHS repeat-associated protein